ncbi:histidine kinase dimerization/phosphoacceptor domain -containing protein [Fodinibius halophilus]|uniref:histidine kinase n=1 Tax=Fodinibius halophilus TaxID=1736908 RepID=A0A6M1TEI8_9BACT|nr:histidine kinase dimerization/phosphoacceptor domain -containing protein [Fodinibius halophilus]NGP88592.1 PAS domain S-box protein [Fodinibius halophilus]
MAFLKKYRTLNSIGLGTILSLFVIIGWHNSQTDLESSLSDNVSNTAHLIVEQFRNAISEDVNKLKNLKKRLEITEGAYFDFWSKDASLLINQDSTLKLIEWIDDSGIIKRVEPYNENKEAIGLDITKLEYRYPEWSKAREDSTFNLTHWLELVQGDHAFLIDAPVYIDGQFKGTITAGIDPSYHFQDILHTFSEYHVQIQDEKGDIFYTFGDSAKTNSLQNFGTVKKIDIGDASKSTWTVTITPNHLFRKDNSTESNTFPLILALVLCGLVSISFFFGLKSLDAEKSLIKTNKKLRSLIDSSPLAICVINTEGIVTDFWNSAAEKMFGWQAEKVIGEHLPLINDDELKDFKTLINESLQEGGVKNKQIKKTRKDGTEGLFMLNIGMISGGEEMLVLIEDITEIKNYQQKIKKSLNEKEFLLTEIHHRVKNNLAIIVGLIDLQKDRISDERVIPILNETQSRIYSISGVHELLYQADDFTEISLAEYIDKLLDKLQQTYQGTERPVLISKEINSFGVNINQAVPLGLLINELITNSFKHAFSDTQIPKITLSIDQKDGYINIHYQDNGKGMSPQVFENKNSLGLNLIRTLIKQLNAEYKLDTDCESGFGLHLEFPVSQKGAHSNI